MIINDFKISIRKTEIVEIDEAAHMLPPDFGPFPEYKVADYLCPEEWSRDGYFIPVEEGQPLWIDLRGNDECACIVSVQRLNPITGKPANLKEGLTKNPEQNYLVLPTQKWIDGYANEGKVYQFIVTKKGEGLAVNEFLLPEDMQDSHAIGFAFFGLRNPKPKAVINTRYYYPTYPTYNPIQIPVDNWYDPSYWNAWTDSVSYDAVRTVFKHTTAPITACKRALQCSGNNVNGAETILYALTNTTQPTFTLPRSKSPLREISAMNASPMLDDDCVETYCTSATGAEADIQDGSLERTVYSLAPDTEDILNAPENLDKASMGAGGRIDQEVLTDDNTIEYYTEKPSATIPVYLVLPDQFRLIMKKGKRQNASKPDKYKHSGKINGTSVPLIKVKS